MFLHAVIYTKMCMCVCVSQPTCICARSLIDSGTTSAVKRQQYRLHDRPSEGAPRPELPNRAHSLRQSSRILCVGGGSPKQGGSQISGPPGLGAYHAASSRSSTAGSRAMAVNLRWSLQVFRRGRTLGRGKALHAVWGTWGTSTCMSHVQHCTFVPKRLQGPNLPHCYIRLCRDQAPTACNLQLEVRTSAVEIWFVAT